MGAVLDDLHPHEGYPRRQLPDGTTTSRWTSSTARFTGYVPACDCGRTGSSRYEPTAAGYDAALDEWEHDHARRLLELVVPHRVQHLLRDTLRAHDDLAAQRRHAAAKALRHLDAGRMAVAERLDERSVAHQPPTRRPALQREQRGRGFGPGR
jgi:hypothetical protein